MAIEMNVEILTSVVVAIATSMAGIITAFLSKRQTRERSEASEEAEEIAKAWEAQLRAHRAAAVEMAVERVPAGLSSEQFTELVDQITNRLPARQAA